MLAAVQKDIIKKMQKGAVLFEWYHGNAFMLSNGSSCRKLVKHQTVKILIDAGLIERTATTDVEYKISELGKSIQP